jgi:hypothetical protein
MRVIWHAMDSEHLCLPILNEACHVFVQLLLIFFWHETLTSFNSERQIADKFEKMCLTFKNG